MLQAKEDLVPYSQHSIFFLTYELAQYARLFHNTKLERLTNAKHSNLLGQFISYKENEVSWICTLFSRMGLIAKPLTEISHANE